MRNLVKKRKLTNYWYAPRRCEVGCAWQGNSGLGSALLMLVTVAHDTRTVVGLESWSGCLNLKEVQMNLIVDGKDAPRPHGVLTWCFVEALKDLCACSIGHAIVHVSIAQGNRNHNIGATICGSL
eukprot:3099425-Amphidinium_carterae.1